MVMMIRNRCMIVVLVHQTEILSAPSALSHLELVGLLVWYRVHSLSASVGTNNHGDRKEEFDDLFIVIWREGSDSPDG